MIRKCAYTGKPAKNKSFVVPKSMHEDAAFNWANSVPADEEYGDLKQGRLPTELEMEISRTFHRLELARTDVMYYELKLKELQDKNNVEFNKNAAKYREERKDRLSNREKQEKQAVIEAQITTESKNQAKELLENRKKKLFE